MTTNNKKCLTLNEKVKLIDSNRKDKLSVKQMCESNQNKIKNTYYGHETVLLFQTL